MAKAEEVLASEKSVLEILGERLAALTEEDFDDSPRELPKNARVVGFMSDHLKRLYALRGRIQKEHVLLHVSDPDSGERLKLFKLTGKLDPRDRPHHELHILGNLIDVHLSAEMNHRFPQTSNQDDVRMAKGGTVYYVEKQSPGGIIMIDGGEVPPELEELIRGFLDG